MKLTDIILDLAWHDKRLAIVRLHWLYVAKHISWEDYTQAHDTIYGVGKCAHAI